MANNRYLVRAIYGGYATKEQAIAFIKALEHSLEKSKEINRNSGFNNKTNSVKSVIRETKEEIDWVKQKYEVKQ